MDLIVTFNIHKDIIDTVNFKAVQGDEYVSALHWFGNIGNLRQVRSID